MSGPVEPWEFKICKEIYGNTLEKVMEYERCLEHYCAKCLTMPDAAFQYMCQTIVSWCCTACCPSGKQLISEEQESGTDHSTKKLRADLDTTLDNMKNMMNDLYKFIAGPSHGKVWKEVVNRKVKPLKEIILEATEEHKRKAEENRRKKNIVIYKAMESAATDSESRKKEDEKIVEIFKSNIEMEDKQIVKTIDTVGKPTRI